MIRQSRQRRHFDIVKLLASMSEIRNKIVKSDNETHKTLDMHMNQNVQARGQPEVM